MKAPTERFAAYRQALAAKVHAGGVKHGKTLEAIATVPRHAFMDAGLHAQAYEDTALPIDRKSTRLNSSHSQQSRMPSSA